MVACLFASALLFTGRVASSHAAASLAAAAAAVTTIAATAAAFRATSKAVAVDFAVVLVLACSACWGF